MAPRRRSPRHRDPFDGFTGLDLSELDLRHLDLETVEGSPPLWPRLLAIMALIAMVVLLLWFPTSHYYVAFGANNAVFFLLCAGATVVGIAVGRMLWRWGEEAAQRYARIWGRRPRPAVGEERPPSAARRHLTLLLALAGTASILFGLPANNQPMGDAEQGRWFLAAGGALVIGILVGRWLLMQGAAVANKPTAKARPPVSLPAWLKWVTLALLLLGAIGTFLLGHGLAPSGRSSSFEFGLGGMGLVVGIFAAIWLARRFDETEARLRSRRHKGRTDTT